MNICRGIFVWLTEGYNVAKQEISPLLLKTIPCWTDVQKGVNAVVNAEKRPFTFFIVMVDESILCGVLPDDPGKAVERRVIRVQRPQVPRSKQAFATGGEVLGRGAARHNFNRM